MVNLKNNIDKLAGQHNALFALDFLQTWDKSQKELEYILDLAQLLKDFRDINISTRCFDSGLAVSIFRDQSTRTRFSFASAANLLGLEVQDMDESKSQIAHGETIRETANMISFLTDIIGIRDDMFLGEGHKYMKEVGDALDEGFKHGVLPQRPGIINLQCDRDHPTQSMADLLHLKNYFGSLENLKGKKIAMTWAYSPSYGKPLSVPQGIIGLMTRFGMDVSLAYPEGYNLIQELEQQAARNARQNNTKFEIVHSMEEAFADANIVYPKSWAPFSVMQQRTELLKNKDAEGLKALEKSCLAQNANFTNWECDEEKMKLTKQGKVLYMHCLPADITGVSCKQGEVSESIFEKYRLTTYIEAGYKPYIIAAMMMANRFDDPGAILGKLFEKGKNRVMI
ncbi:MAG: knotted carbamoyltransferase YgeW [Bacteroidales bacterium]|nr:knotted carbamoyltransferase YgeW [Bacteroidales bacterium]